MPANLNFFDNYVLMAITEEIVPQTSFFKDRYFPTGADDIFNADKVLTEYQKGDRRMACFVAPRVGDIPVDRMGYEIREYQPAYIAPSRLLTLDDLAKRGFGEALYPGSTPAERAVRLQLKDLSFLDRRIARREEWMAVQTMINNACTMQEYIDSTTKGETNYVYFYENKSEHTYTVSTAWNNGGNILDDVQAMCEMLAKRGLPAVDLILGPKAAATLLENKNIRELLDRNSGVAIGSINQNIVYPGVVNMGTLNFGGFELNVFKVFESYEDEHGNDTPYFPSTSAMVTAPACGHMMYGKITQIDYGSAEYSSYAAVRVPKFVLDQDKDVRKLRLGARPLAAPRNYCPYIYAANVCV